MTFNCEKLNNLIGSECTPFGDYIGLITPAYSVPTKPITAFFKELDSGKIVITDASNTAFEAWSLIPKSNTKFLSSYIKRIVNAGANYNNGEISIESNSKNLHRDYFIFLSACIDAFNFTQESLNIDEESWHIIDDIEKAILKRNNKIEITKNIKVSGGGNIEAYFPLKANNTLIDAIRPHSASTGAVLRKSLAITQVGYDAPLIIIDDTLKPEQAKNEAFAISAVCRTMMFSQLTQQQEPMRL